MIAISISESLPEGPTTWPTWNGDVDAMQCMNNMQTSYDGQAEWWGSDGYAATQQHLAEQQGMDRTGVMEQMMPLLDSQQPPEPEPAKIAAEGGKVPLSAFASPLRVPVPEPLSGDEVPDLALEISTWDEAEGLEGGQLLDIGLSPTAMAQPMSTPQVAEQAADRQGITIVDTPNGKLIEWQIDGFSSKVQGSNGRPLVSPPFTVLGLPNLRLMASVQSRDAGKAAKNAKSKGANKKDAKKGPLTGSLKLKADCLENATFMKCKLNVGQVNIGPFCFDFSQQAVHGPDDFGLDWNGQVDLSSGALRVGVEIVEVTRA